MLHGSPISVKNSLLMRAHLTTLTYALCANECFILKSQIACTMFNLVLMLWQFQVLASDYFDTYGALGFRFLSETILIPILLLLYFYMYGHKNMFFFSKNCTSQMFHLKIALILEFYTSRKSFKDTIIVIYEYQTNVIAWWKDSERPVAKFSLFCGFMLPGSSIW